MTCASGKVGYGTRRAASRAKRRQPHRAGLRTYPCPDCGMFHLGHLPARVIAGTVTRGDVYGAQEG